MHARHILHVHVLRDIKRCLHIHMYIHRYIHIYDMDDHVHISVFRELVQCKHLIASVDDVQTNGCRQDGGGLGHNGMSSRPAVFRTYLFL